MTLDLLDTLRMKFETAPYKIHVFVCTNQKSGRCCADEGADKLRKELKDWVKEKGWKKLVRINSSGCLDRCKEGVAIAIYPQNEWILNVRPKDADEVKAEIESMMKKIDLRD